MGGKPPQVSYLTETDGTMRLYRDGCISVVLNYERMQRSTLV
jgi:hypothetical protein